jgi:hypothetical protein
MNREVCGICWCPYDDNGACGCKPQTGVSMNREDIIRMAREAGLRLDKHNGGFVDQSELLRFAALVAAAEREACAKLAEATICDTHLPTGVRIYGTRVADAIRARGSA